MRRSTYSPIPPPCEGGGEGEVNCARLAPIRTGALRPFDKYFYLSCVGAVRDPPLRRIL